MVSREDFLQHYVKGMKKKFGAQPNLKSFLAEMNMAFQWATKADQTALLLEGDACIVLTSSLSSDRVQFGFLILSEDREVNEQLWRRVLEQVRAWDGNRLVGPIQATTYFPYRFVTESDGSSFFKGEYFSEPSDHEFMMEQMPATVHYFRSGYRNFFKGIMKVSEPYYQKAKEAGLEIRAHAKVDLDLFQNVAGLIDQIFGSNWSFQQLPKEVLQQLYASEFGKEQRLALHTFHLNNALIGFCRYVQEDDHTLICKTLGILPAYQKMGLGNATVYQMHADAEDAGYTRMIYALIYDGNRVQQNMPKDDSVIFRKYASYEFELR